MAEKKGKGENTITMAFFEVGDGQSCDEALRDAEMKQAVTEILKSAASKNGGIIFPERVFGCATLPELIATVDGLDVVSALAVETIAEDLARAFQRAQEKLPSQEERVKKARKEVNETKSQAETLSGKLDVLLECTNDVDSYRRQFETQLRDYVQALKDAIEPINKKLGENNLKGIEIAEICDDQNVEQVIGMMLGTVARWENGTSRDAGAMMITKKKTLEQSAAGLQNLIKTMATELEQLKQGSKGIDTLRESLVTTGEDIRAKYPNAA